MDNNKYKYLLFPPFIDAYKNSESDSPRSLTEIQEFAEKFAHQWGESLIGYAVLNNKQIPKHNNQIVLCCVFVYGSTTTEYLVVTDGKTDTNSWWQNLHFLQAPILPEWNLT